MGFLQPSPPPFDLEWKRQPFLTRLKANAQDWAVNGFGTPGAVYLLYIVKLAFFFVGGLILIGLTTPGLGGPGDFTDWWSQPIVFQKLAVWTLVWENPRARLGFDAARLAVLPADRRGPVLAAAGDSAPSPFPDKVPFTRRIFRRTWLDGCTPP